MIRLLKQRRGPLLGDVNFGERNLLALPQDPNLAAWIKAWFNACTGLTCNGIRVGFWNSLRILVPSVVVSISIGAITGYALSLWRPRGATILFGTMMAVAFVPYQVFIYPLVRIFSNFGLSHKADESP